MRTDRPAVLATAAAVAVLLLAGCSGTPAEIPEASLTADPGASVDPLPSAEPSPEPTETAEPVDPHPALADLIISTAGLGPLTVGSTPPATNPGAAMVAWDEAFCSGEMWEGDGDPGRWVPSGYDNDTNYMGEPARPFYVDAVDAGVHRIDVMGTSPHTVEGIRIGSTLAELQATYPALAGPFAGPVSKVWWIQDAAGSVAFETQGEDMLGAGAPEQVILIRVLAPGVSPEFGAANSGNVAGACF